MPPTGRPRPEPAVSARLAAFLEDGLDRAAAAAPNAGRIPPHRLNRTEYANAVRDLLGVDIPPTAAGGQLHSRVRQHRRRAPVSPVLLERYMAVARQVSRLAVGDDDDGGAVTFTTSTRRCGRPIARAKTVRPGASPSSTTSRSTANTSSRCV
jgi:hypothetical protein